LHTGISNILQQVLLEYTNLIADEAIKVIPHPALTPT